MAFRLNFDTGNAAFDEDDRAAEVARILRAAATAIERGSRDGVLHDINGNRVGSFKLSREG